MQANPRITAKLMLGLILSSMANPAPAATDTGQINCYNNSQIIKCPRAGQPFYGQDAQYGNNDTAYINNHNGTISDKNTGLMWSKAVDSKKVSLKEAERIAGNMRLGGYSDWRIPNIKELYSLVVFQGYTGFNRSRDLKSVPKNAKPFIDTRFFDFRYGDTNRGERYIDAQWLSSTLYTSTTMNGNPTLFGVNFADGRIKGYGYGQPRGRRGEKKFYARYVRGASYGDNLFTATSEGTVIDQSSQLMWQQTDSGKPMDWQEALNYAENLVFAGHDDWRLPNAKELQYLVDYSRAPDSSNSAAIDPVFETSTITNEMGDRDYPYFWTSTTHLDGPHPGGNAVYVAFGRAPGKMRGNIMDVHGAGAQRSDPKKGRGTSWRGPQGDARRTYNYVRVVRDITASDR